ncbi:MAG: hypothetical protein HUJ25_05025 [Crocinitomicaceae bacterium]|nr:hypothetical protein [Crocinitomicaceae bacterium]
MVELGIIDWVLWLAYVCLASLLLILYRNSKIDDPSYRFFLPGFAIKTLGGLVFGLVYIYYYPGGDTTEYYKNASILFEVQTENFTDYLRLMSSEAGQIPGDLKDYGSRMGYSSGQEEWFMVRVLSIVNFIGFNSFLVTTFLISLISFLGVWKLFKVFSGFVQKTHWAFIAAFLTPSVVFWGSGILKDTMVMFTLSIMIWACYRLFYLKERKITLFILFLIMGYAAFRFKSYVLILFLPAMLIGLYVQFRKSIKSRIVKLLVTPILLTGITIGGYQGVLFLTTSSGKYDLNGIEGKVKGFHSWHVYQGGSVYTLGEIEYTATGVMKKIPAALNVTFFRPYLWEASNIVVFFGAIESLIFLLLVLRLLFLRTYNLKLLFTHPFFVMLFVYILLLGFAVGFTSFNFGALARYKIPVMSMFSFILLAFNFDPLYQRFKDISHKTVSSL